MTRSIRSGANRGCLLSLLAKEKGRAFFVVIAGGSHEIYAGRMKVEGPFDSLRGIAAPSHYVRDLLEPLPLVELLRSSPFSRDLSEPRLAPFPNLAADGRAGPEFRPDSSLFEQLPRTQTRRSQLSWAEQTNM